MTKKETDKLYSDIIKKLHYQDGHSTFMKKHYYQEINGLLSIGVPLENIKWYITVWETIRPILVTRLEADHKNAIALADLPDSEIQDWWRKVYEILGVNKKELTDSIKGRNNNETDNSRQS